MLYDSVPLALSELIRAEAMAIVNRVLKREPESKRDLFAYMVEWPDKMDVNRWYYKEMGSVDYTDDLMNANSSLLGYFSFPSGIVLTIPDVQETGASTLPPWKQVRK